ncbi:MAG: hypothetical protein GEU91_20055 [Rhizobiales bacterium]|nr:hypothetical protein [Hyphomicrobiales bacterium]
MLRRKRFDMVVRRRREIEIHARGVGAADTDDLDRWLIAWHWHNRNSKDPIAALTECARRMGRRGMAEAEARGIIEEAASTRRHRSADNLGRWLRLSYAQRQASGITTIGAYDVNKRARKEQRKHRNRLAAERRRRARGAKLRTEYEAKGLSRTKPWEAEGMSRRNWYRQRSKLGTNGTTPSTAVFSSSGDALVPTAPSPPAARPKARRGRSANCAVVPMLRRRASGE